MPVIDAVTLALIGREISHIKDGKTVQIKIVKNRKYGLLSDSIEEFANKIADMSAKKIKVKQSDTNTAYPHMKIAENISYYGIPSGFMTGVFIHFIVDMIKEEFLVGKDIIDGIRKIKRDVEIEMYTSPSCSVSPPAMRWVLEFGYLNKKIKVDIIDCVQFPEAGLRKGITSTPTIIVNNKIKIVGIPTPDELLRKIRLA
jgi:alkyl hydroperoxide reductase subunit AhpF